MTIKVKNKLTAYILNDIWDESGSRLHLFVWIINFASIFFSLATYAPIMIFLFLKIFPSFIPNFFLAASINNFHKLSNSKT